MMTRIAVIVVASLVVGSANAAAQAAPKNKKGAPAAPVVPSGPPPPSPPPNYEYAAEGRRDPFVNLFKRGTDETTTTKTSKRAEGAAGMMTGELVVRGIIQVRGAFVAMVAGPDGKVYSVRAGDRIGDGVIRNITAQAVVILQEVNNPLSLEKQREVRKLLRGGEEVK